MEIFKKCIKWKKAQAQKPKTILSIWIAFGVIFGIGIDNIGVGIAIGVALGVALSKKKKITKKRK